MKTPNIIAFVLITVIIALTGTSCSPKRWYVSAQGSDDNKGTSEQKPFKTLAKALTTAAVAKKDVTILIIGTLNAESEGEDGEAVFLIGETRERTITICGKENAGERTVLKGGLLKIGDKAAIRLENIEISGSLANGIVVGEPAPEEDDDRTGSVLTLGKGAKVSDHLETGIIVNGKSTLNMEGGEVTGNKNRGVVIEKDAVFTMTDGSINHNIVTGLYGAGVVVRGSFTMEGGDISDNRTERSSRYPGAAGGIFVDEDAHFTLKGGQIVNNRAEGRTSNVVGSGGGGAVVVFGSKNGTTFIMEGGEIHGNTAERFGGGVLLITDQGEKGVFTMTGGTITGNTARGAGGIQNYGGRFKFTITGGDISGNTPDDVSDGWSW